MADTDRGEGPTRSSYARVARSSSSPLLEERASARRWTTAETRARMGAAPKFQFEPPSDALVDHLVKRYQDVTGDQIRSRPKRNLLAACYRLHGPDLVPFIAHQFAVQGTAQNLLGIIRCSSPRGSDDGQPAADNGVGPGTDASPVPQFSDVAHDRPNDHHGPPCPIECCLPNLIHCYGHWPAFDPRSQRRYDRHPSNPDAARYFSAPGNGSGLGALANNAARAK